MTRQSEIGHIVDGRYEIEAGIGQGGSGAVYRARHLELALPVAIKLLRAHAHDSSLARGRLAREARALAAMQHPNIVSVIDFGSYEERPYLVMELLHGETLAARLQRGALSLDTILGTMQQLLRALCFLHAAGLVHRDLKPSNVFLQHLPYGAERVKLIDFGLVRSTWAGALGHYGQLTSDGSVVGTPVYMAPEQARGQDVDARADVYGVGVLLFRMLTGHLPHLPGDLPALARDWPEADPALITALERLLQRALAWRREERFDNAADMLRSLAQIARGGAAQRVTITAQEPETEELATEELRPAAAQRGAFRVARAWPAAVALLMACAAWLACDRHPTLRAADARPQPTAAVATTADSPQPSKPAALLAEHAAPLSDAAAPRAAETRKPCARASLAYATGPRRGVIDFGGRR